MKQKARADWVKEQEVSRLFYVLERAPGEIGKGGCFYAHAPEFEGAPDHIVPVGTGYTAEEAVRTLRISIQVSVCPCCTSCLRGNKRVLKADLPLPADRYQAGTEGESANLTGELPKLGAVSEVGRWNGRAVLYDSR